MPKTHATPVVEVRDFALTIRDKKIITNVSFTVKAGEVLALLGANGSGKTSTIRSLLGIYTASSGTLHVNGEKITPERSGLVGYLPEERGLYVRTKVLEVMTYFGELKGMSRPDARAFALSYLERVGLSDKAGTQLKKLSGGQQQKIQLGVAIMGDPELLILDEPTKGLDPMNRHLLIDIVQERQAKGCAVIYTTHLMEEVEKLADSVLILKDGTTHAYGSVDELKKQFKATSIDEVFIHVYEGADNE